MFWGAIIFFILLAGFAYVIWVISARETGTLKTIGQIMAVVIALIAVISLVYGGFGGRYGWHGRMMNCPMMKSEEMMMDSYKKGDKRYHHMRSPREKYKEKMPDEHMDMNNDGVDKVE